MCLENYVFYVENVNMLLLYVHTICLVCGNGLLNNISSENSLNSALLASKSDIWSLQYRPSREAYSKKQAKS